MGKSLRLGGHFGRPAHPCTRLPKGNHEGSCRPRKASIGAVKRTVPVLQGSRLDSQKLNVKGGQLGPFIRTREADQSVKETSARTGGTLAFPAAVAQTRRHWKASRC